ncbi:TPA: hypothetical protein N0F65_010116 [Lagenidium giganteum]|uniref:Uncharacterized protein n=1 Tax=Lagenidium giganteum TaxID=4803 RepID=A0AAV2YMK0_9STRA|nr:TPA: hypothetical protein N0F65_010116 [Lagenidium giganteum]
MSVKATVDPKLLETICLYQSQKPVDERVGTVVNGTVPDLDQLFGKNLEIDLQEQKIEARVMKYFTDFM